MKREITYPSRKQITETYNTTALAQMVKEAGAKGFRTLTLAGKEYNFGIFSPIFPPAGGASEAADDLAHIWSVTYDQSSPSGVCGCTSKGRKPVSIEMPQSTACAYRVPNG